MMIHIDLHMHIKIINIKSKIVDFITHVHTHTRIHTYICICAYLKPTIQFSLLFPYTVAVKCYAVNYNMV